MVFSINIKKDEDFYAISEFSLTSYGPDLVKAMAKLSSLPNPKN